MIAAEAMPTGHEEPLALDSVSFRVFYDEALPRVYGYLLRRCGGSVAIAEDLTQETFLAAVRELRRKRPIDAPVPWILGIARHKLVDHYRRSETRAPDLELLDDPELPTAEPDASDELGLTALDQVPAAQRAALVLRHLDELSVPEVAAVLGRSVEAVESLLARGRVSFRRAYLEVSK
jgi:RNA polymerase sigma-70 factor, ECF subfamily